jgi:hypothetical protein
VRTYSTSLVEKCKEYFHRVHHTDISDDTANEYLRSFAKLYLAFNRPNGDSSRPTTSVEDGCTPLVEKADGEVSSLTRSTRVRGIESKEAYQLDSMHKGSVTTVKA